MQTLKFEEVVAAFVETLILLPGHQVAVSGRSPIGHYRMPTYLRGKRGSVENAIVPRAVDKEGEAFSRSAGSKGH